MGDLTRKEGEHKHIEIGPETEQTKVRNEQAKKALIKELGLGSLEKPVLMIPTPKFSRQIRSNKPKN